MKNLDSYVAASKFPWKLVQQREKIFTSSGIVPYHVQFIPTNRCNANCEWCSCKGVDRTIEMPFEESRCMLQYFHDLGMKAITITGGGEPSMHPDIRLILEMCKALGVKVGIVTNGITWSKASDVSWLNRIATWLRLSIINTVGNYNMSIPQGIIEKLPNVDVGMSFVVTPGVNVDTAVRICRLAEEKSNVTHIRFVHDILDPKESSMTYLREKCQDQTSKAIFQSRSIYTPGTRNCLISRLKPVVDATGYVYPCCGVQYASDDTKRMPEAFKMCHWRDFHNTPHFNGEGCIKCYYNDYNETLAKLMAPLEHEEFV